MRLEPIIVALAGAAVLAQVEVDPRRLPVALRSFEPREGETPLRCEVVAMKPVLDFGFRFQSGFMMRVPLNQYRGAGHRWTVLARVTPEAGERRPVYLMERFRLPEVPETKAIGEVGGGFLVGEGKYAVDWMLLDDSGRTCRKHWRFEAKASRSERSAGLRMPPNTASGFSLRLPRLSDAAAGDTRRIRLTLLIHAAPMSRRSVALRQADRVMLLGLVSSLLDHVRVRSVRLAVFNLEQQRELLWDEAFDPRRLYRVAQSLNTLQLGTVHVDTLRNRHGDVDLLSDMLNRELRAPEPSDAVVFLGPRAWQWDKVPNTALEKHDTAPRFFYFQYEPFIRRQATLPDMIARTLSSLHGKTVVIHTPADFARALRQLGS